MIIKPKRKLTLKEREQFVDFVSAGLPISSAAKLVGITEAQLLEYYKSGRNGRELKCSLERACSEAELKLVTKVMGNNITARDALAVLQSRYPENWNAKTKGEAFNSKTAITKQLLNNLQTIPEVRRN